MEDISSLLLNWGIAPEAIKNFMDNEVTIEMLKSLSDEYLKELVPIVGQRIKIKDCIYQYMSGIRSEQQVSESSVTTVDDNFVIDENTPIDIIEGQDVLKDLLNSSFDLMIRPKFRDFDLNTLLQTSALGNSVLNYYKTNKCLDGTRRTRLVDIIIKHLYTYIIKNRLKHDDYNLLSAKIIQLFPNETVGTYYVPAIRKNMSPTGKPILAKGRLVDKCRNIIHKCGEASVIRKRKKNHEETDYDGAEKKTALAEAEDPKQNEDYNWLKFNCEPWATVIEKWNRTFAIRRKEKCDSMEEFIKEWPILNDLRAEVLINCDFEKLYPDSMLSLYLNWDVFFQTIFSLKAKDINESTALNLIESMKTCENEDGKLAFQITLLSHLIPPKGRTKISKQHWKYSTLESVEAIIVHAKSATQIYELLEKQKETASSHKQTVQPYLLVVGPLEAPESFFIVVDKIKYECDNLKKAFDLLFKTFHVLDAKYPVQAEHLWTIIQKGLYKINTCSDNVPPYTLHIINAIDMALK